MIPFQVRMWDLLFVHGDIVLFWFAYALLQLNTELIASANDQ